MCDTFGGAAASVGPAVASAPRGRRRIQQAFVLLRRPRGGDAIGPPLASRTRGGCVKSRRWGSSRVDGAATPALRPRGKEVRFDAEAEIGLRGLVGVIDDFALRHGNARGP